LELVIAHAEDPSFGDEFTLDTYKTAKKRRPDPSIYNPNAIDPDAIDDRNMLMLTNGEDPAGVGGHRRYMEDPPLKPKRDPTMYVDGSITDDPSLYTAKYGQGSVGSGAKYASDPQGMEESEDEDPFGDYPKQRSMYMGSETGAEFMRGTKDPSFYAPPQHHTSCDQSFRTQEPDMSLGGRSGHSKKSRKSSRSEEPGRRVNNSAHVAESLASSWGDVMDGMGGMRQKSKSFY
jgi:hypothetical protein